MFDLVKTRFNMLKEMDEIIRDGVGDEEIDEIWFSVGVPDEASDDDLMFIAKDDNLFADIVRIFSNIINNEIE